MRKFISRIRKEHIIAAASYLAQVCSAWQLAVVIDLLVESPVISVISGVLFFVVVATIRNAQNRQSRFFWLLLVGVILVCKIGPSLAEAIELHGNEIDSRMVHAAVQSPQSADVFVPDHSPCHALSISRHCIWLATFHPLDLLVAIILTLIAYCVFDLLGTVLDSFCSTPGKV